MQILKGTYKKLPGIFDINITVIGLHKTMECSVSLTKSFSCVSLYLVSNNFKSVPELAYTSMLILIVKGFLSVA